MFFRFFTIILVLKKEVKVSKDWDEVKERGILWEVDLVR